MSSNMNIPKFTSFRPKPQPPAEPSKESRKPEKSKKLERSSAERIRERERSDTRCEDDRRSSLRDSEPSKPYFSDRRGDRDIAKYGSINKYDIPAYRLSGHGCVLGLPTDRKIDRDHSSSKEIVITPVRGRRQERLLMDKHVARERNRTLRFMKSARDSRPDIDADFVPLSTTSKQKPDDEEGGNDSAVDYRGLQRDATTRKPSDPDAEYESDTQINNTDTEITQRNSALVRRTREHPEDLQSWLELIEHQEAMMKIDRSSLDLTTSDKQHLADVRISIYEQALRKIGTNEDSLVKLYSGLMTEAKRAWDEERVTIKWAEILTQFATKEELWIQYLDFIQSSFTRFKYEGCRAAFFKCLKTLQASPHKASIDMMLHIVVRLTSMIQQAGYHELAIAAWQAMLEFHFLNPKTPDKKDDLRSFEEFWESEVARIGETNARGWGDFNADEAQPTISCPELLEAADPSMPTLKDFCKREVDYTMKLRYPGRTTDDIGEDDPFHTILFSDIEEFLQVVPRGTPGLPILSAFLCFCGLPALPRLESNTLEHWLDPLLQSQFRKASVHSDGSSSFTDALAKYESCLMNGFQMTAEHLFTKPFPENLETVSAIFLRRVLHLLAGDTMHGESISEYLLAFESKYFPTEVVKTTKQLIRARPTSLRLYNAYGLIETCRGNSAKASQVFSGALSMQKGDAPFSTPGSIDLFSNWIWEALHRNEKREALWRLVSRKGQISKTSLILDNSPDQAALLRARTTLTETNERALLSNEYFTAVTSTSILALLSYLTSDSDLHSALKVHKILTTYFASRNLSLTPTAELHAESIAHLLRYHATHATIVKPSLLRDALEPLLSCFPNNIILLSLYAANESRFSIDDRVRSVMHQSLRSNGKERSIVGWAFAIHHETLRSKIAGSTAHSVRALFCKAESDVGAHCPALWKQHILFELDEARKERTKRLNRKPRKDDKMRKEKRAEEVYRRVKETFFKGITQLPWCKDLMMMGFTHLGDEVFRDEELRRVYEVMVEKELRVYVEIEEETD